MSFTGAYLRELESEAIYIFRELQALFDKPVLLFSGGKDSIILLHLAKKAFYPGKIPFPILHVDTGHNFQETIEFRDKTVEEQQLKLIVGCVQAAIDRGQLTEETGYHASRNILQTSVLLDCLEKHKFDAAIGGGRRDEEKARAKERIFSHRNAFGQWEPKNQRPELWNLFNTRKFPGEHFRVFPLSNWTELDIWQYIKMENIDIPGIYFSHKRKVFDRDGVLLVDSPFIPKKPMERVFEERVRCRTIGDMSNTGVWKSEARTLDEIIEEVSCSVYTERGQRADDKRSDTSMEDRKKQGYF